MKPGKVRPIAVCVFRKDDHILVAEGCDATKQQFFYRPLGGTIEFGEYSQETVVRELKEEIGADITDVRHLATIENIFTYNGQTGHEIVQVYEGSFVDKSIYEMGTIIGHEPDDASIKAVWKPLIDFKEGKAPLYPDGLVEVLEQIYENAKHRNSTGLH